MNQTQVSFFDAEIQPQLDSLMEDIQAAGLSRSQEREVIIMICSCIFGWGIGVTDEIEGISRDSDPTVSDIRRFCDHLLACIETNDASRGEQKLAQ